MLQVDATGLTVSTKMKHQGTPPASARKLALLAGLGSNVNSPLAGTPMTAKSGLVSRTYTPGSDVFDGLITPKVYAAAAGFFEGATDGTGLSRQVSRLSLPGSRLSRQGSRLLSARGDRPSARGGAEAGADDRIPAVFPTEDGSLSARRHYLTPRTLAAAAAGAEAGAAAADGSITPGRGTAAYGPPSSLPAIRTALRLRPLGEGQEDGDAAAGKQQQEGAAGAEQQGSNSGSPTGADAAAAAAAAAGVAAGAASAVKAAGSSRKGRRSRQARAEGEAAAGAAFSYT